MCERREPTVVQIKRSGDRIVQNCTCYVGRRWTMGGWNLPHSKWANPFAIKKPSTTLISEWNALNRAQKILKKKEYEMNERQRVLQEYEQYLRKNKMLIDTLPELTGHTLGCFCVDKVKRPTPETLICHAEILVKLWRENYSI